MINTFLYENAAGHRSNNYKSLYRLGGKRVLDVMIVLLSLPFWAPVLLVLITISAILTRSPIYIQKRVGRNGNEFQMFKLRTMVRDADAKLDEYLQSNPEARAEWNLHQKLVHDPRVTAFGRFLRKSSMDELPQILNVLLGQMSIVGPRPMLPEQKSMYPGNSYYRMRPGITCLWQVSERNKSAFAAREAYDSRYYRVMSLRTDIWILFRTVGVVFSCNGH